MPVISSSAQSLEWERIDRIVGCLANENKQDRVAWPIGGFTCTRRGQKTGRL